MTDTEINHDRVIGVQYTPITEEDVFEEEKHKKQHTLEEFAIDHFRPPPKSSISRRQGILTKDLWSHTKTPMKLPLLKSLQNDPQLVKGGVAIFKHILKYSGEYPTTKTNQACAFTDGIFGPAISESKLRDEVYCQIIKQLTGNRLNNDICGWELMWLVTGTFACTDFVMAEVDQFLHSARRRWLAKDCLERLQKTIRKGSRLYPPNIVEVETIKFKMTKILNTVFYPNDTEGFFEVDSGTKVSDFEEAIMERLEMKPTDEFKLFVKVADTVVSLPGDMFFYDYMRHDHLVKQSRPEITETDPNEIYKLVAVIFMRKMWSKMVPGQDPAADNIFHYHQELPKYLRGWHDCTKEDAARLAALVCRIKTADKKKFGELSEHNMPSIEELLPKDLKGNMLEKEWKKDILVSYRENEDDKKTSGEAKTEFLNIIFQWPTFGSAFIDIKQKALPNYAEHLLVATNKNGLTLMEPETKELLKTWPFTQIVKCYGDETHFEMIVKDEPKKRKIKFDTDLGYKISDLVTSYKENMKSRTAAEL